MANLPSTEAPLEDQAAEALIGLLGHGAKYFLEQNPGTKGLDFGVAWQGVKLAVELKRSGEAVAIRSAIEKLAAYCGEHPNEIPIVATQFMGTVGKELCAAHGVGWFDLSGNADITGPGLRILIQGKPNKFKRPGRPSTIFAPKSSRIARWLLMFGDTGWTQKELSEWTGLDKGYTSKLLKRLRGQALVTEEQERYTPRDRNLLLKAWQARYDFSKHRIIKGVIPARSGEEAARKLASVLKEDEYAATGLAGAWFLDHFASFRIATFYLKAAPSADFLQQLSFKEGEKGANVWLVVPNDEGVFQGMGEADGVTCAHWVQVYLDLAAHPERANEAAEHLRETRQNWEAR